MKGSGTAHGAVSVLNAIPTGVGGAVGIDLKVEARVELLEESRVMIESKTPWGPVKPNPRLVNALWHTSLLLGHKGGLMVELYSEIPPASGLKSSSAVINAVALALLDAIGCEENPYRVALLGSRAARRAGLTITGGLDDSLSTLLEGVFITDNHHETILRRYNAGSDLYAVITLPAPGKPIYTVSQETYKWYKSQYEVAVREALNGDWTTAMTINGILTIIAGGWGGDPLKLIAQALSRPSVIAAGMSGKGPAVFAVTSDPDEVARIWKGNTLVARIRGGGS